MFVLSMRPGDSVSVGHYTVALCESSAERVRLALNATGAERVQLMPEGIAVAPRITVWRALHEQIHIDDDIQVWVIKLETNRVRIGIEAELGRQIVRSHLIHDDPDPI
jgi:carbon storage regulator CsrA